MRGRKPLPSTVKRLRNTLRKDRVRVGNRDTSTAIPPLTTAQVFGGGIPSELRGDADAVREWQRLAAFMGPLRIVSRLDRAAVLAVCLEWSQYLRANRISRRGDMTVQRGSGGRGIAPSIAVAHRSLQALLRLWPELQMTPRSRAAAIDTPPIDGDWLSRLETEDPRPN